MVGEFSASKLKDSPSERENVDNLVTRIPRISYRSPLSCGIEV